MIAAGLRVLQHNVRLGLPPDGHLPPLKRSLAAVGLDVRISHSGVILADQVGKVESSNFPPVFPPRCSIPEHPGSTVRVVNSPGSAADEHRSAVTPWLETMILRASRLCASLPLSRRRIVCG